jgi:hypothetical protein
MGNLSLSKSWDEKRRHRRVHMQHDVGLAVVRRGHILPLKRPQWQARLHDVSSSGMRLELESDRPIPVNSEVKIWTRIKVEDIVRDVELLGDVVWARPDEATQAFQLGVQLRPHPKRAVRTWERGVLEYIRKFDR